MTTDDGRRRRWGRVTARPCEYLIQLRGGKVLRHGPGLSVFVWPGDAVAVLPTSIRRISFAADQITAEKTGVAVTGMGVCRIAEPLLAFRMLDLDDPAAGLDRLAEVLRDMLVGATRRLVATMTVEECLTRRKENIAEELLREIRPVLSGRGRADDGADQGWGIVLDTIEIQDVRIQSEKVFSDLQASYRTALELRAREAQVARDREIGLREAEAERSRMETEQDLQHRRAELARRKAELDAAGAAEALRREGELADQRIRQEQAAEDAVAGARRAREAAEAEQGAKLERLALETERLGDEVRALAARRAREVENLLPDERLRYELITRALPAIAQAFAESFGPIHVTALGPGGEAGQGLTLLSKAFAEVLAVARSAGVELPGFRRVEEGQAKQS